MMAAPSVYGAIIAVTAELTQCGLPKNRTNPVDGYRYRSIDDLVGILSPLLAKHRLCVLPLVLDRTIVERQGTRESLLLNVALRVAFDLVSAEDGSRHRVEAFGEALDPSDKATAKAMSAAYKSAMLQTFCVPVSAEDADLESHKLKASVAIIEPAQGWEQWALDIGDILGVCESHEAVNLVQDRNRALLAALSRERADLYAELGCAFTARREALGRRAMGPESLNGDPGRRKRPAKSRQPQIEVRND